MTTKKTSRPTKCSCKNGKVVLCASMGKYLASNHGTGGRTKGLFMLDNFMDMETGVCRNMGPLYRPGGKDPGVLFNFCPWCGSDLAENWRIPEEKRQAKKIAKIKKQEAAAAKAS